ncbi:MAG: hypothetical protein QHJ34_13175 [bacterium]|nr:hypothetical protein [candidate division KSB1 bacterium]MDH7561164.1 hypothetical protein [bacterium]
MKWQLVVGIVFGLVGGAGLALAQSAARIAPLDARPGQNAVYELRFVAHDTLRSSALIELVLPGAFDVSGVQLASSRTLDGGFTVNVVADTVRLRRSGLGKAVPPGTTVDLLFAAVHNPKSWAAIGSGQASVKIFPRPGARPQALVLPVTTDTTSQGR